MIPSGLKENIVVFFKKWANPVLFSFILIFFQTNDTIFTSN